MHKIKEISQIFATIRNFLIIKDDLEYGDLGCRQLRLSHVRKATPGYARQSCTGMPPGTLGYGPTTPHHGRETFEKHAFLERTFFFSRLKYTQIY